MAQTCVCYGNRVSDLSAALRAAVFKGHHQCFTLLTAAGANVNSVISIGKTPLLCATECGMERTMALLIEAGADVNKPFRRSGETPLMKAVKHGHVNCARLLLDSGADVNTRCGQGYTALFRAVERNHTVLVDILIEAGADVNVFTGYGTTALIEAAWNTRDRCLERLLAAGADVNVTDIYGSTPLIKTSTFDIRYSRLLLRAGARVNAVNRFNRTALMYHLEYSNPGNLPQAVLLYAAGDTARWDGLHRSDSYTQAFREYLTSQESRLCLAHACRKVIRSHLVAMYPGVSLFHNVPQLGLPKLLEGYLVHNSSLDDDVANE